MMLVIEEAPAERLGGIRWSDPNKPREAAVAEKACGRPEPVMKVARSVSEAIGEHVTLAIESIDRLYMNLYVPILQRPEGAGHFWIHHRGHRFASTALMAPMTRSFVAAIERFSKKEDVEIVRFRKGQRKEDVAAAARRDFSAEEGVVLIGKAQEKATVMRTERRRNETTGATYPWLVKSTAMVNQYYFYCVDSDFGGFFIKFCSYFPYTGKVCLNGHEYLKRQLEKEGIDYEELDNGVLSCADPQRAQQICDQLSPELIDQLVRKWLSRLPHPFSAQDRAAGYTYDLSVWQSEFALTQVFDRPLTGRLFFEQVIRDNLDLGRPDRVQLVFARRVIRTTPGRFRTRLITEGVVPTLYIDYKSTRVKQYHKLGRALRTETTINDTRDFTIGRRLKNLPALREIGFQANRRLLDVQRISQDATIGEDALQQVLQPAVVDGQRAGALRFGDPRVLALLAALILFRLLPRGFTNKDLREHVAPLRGLELHQLSTGSMTYDLRRLRLHGFIRRIPKTRRYRVTHAGFRTALFLYRSYARLLRPGLATLQPELEPTATIPLRAAFKRVDAEISKAWEKQQLAA